MKYLITLFILACSVATPALASLPFETKNEGSLLNKVWAQTVLIKTYPDAVSCEVNGSALKRHKTEQAFVYTSYPKKGDSISITCEHEGLNTVKRMEIVSFDEAYYKKMKKVAAVSLFVAAGPLAAASASIVDIPFAYFYPGIISLIFNTDDSEHLKSAHFKIKEDWAKLLALKYSDTCKRKNNLLLLCEREQVLLSSGQSELAQTGYQESEEDIVKPNLKVNFGSERAYWLQESGKLRTKLKLGRINHKRRGKNKINAACIHVEFDISAEGVSQNEKVIKIYPVDKEMAELSLKEIKEIRFKLSPLNTIGQPIRTNRIMTYWGLDIENYSGSRKKKIKTFKKLIDESCI